MAVPPAEPQAGVRVGEDDPRIQAGPVELRGNGAALKGYLSRPTGPGPHPGVLVIHENRGMLPHFPDVTRRLAAEGYAALAVDMLSRGAGRVPSPVPTTQGMLCERLSKTRS
jgi:carboxymethylenebutenolidase